jgi:predicted dehydrogenase
MPKLKVSVVGCGRVANMLHLPSLLALEDRLSVVALCDTDKASADKMAARYGIKSSFSSMAEMLAQAKPDIVDICTPPQAHRALAIKAMEAGCHVLVEKPMGMSVNECDEMASASERNGVKLCAVHNQRFHPVFLAAKRILDSGLMGKNQDVRLFYMVKDSTYLSKTHWASGLPGGILFDYLPHQIYLSLALIKGCKGITVRQWEDKSDPDAPQSQYKFELEGDGIGSTIFISYPSRSWRFTIDITCSEGSLNVDFLNGILLKDRLESLSIFRKNVHSLGIAGQFLKGAFISGIRPSLKRWPISHRNLIEKFVDSIITNSDVPVPVSEASETIRIMGMALEKLSLTKTATVR